MVWFFLRGGRTGPVRMGKDDLAFMFESTYAMKLTPWADEDAKKNADYYKCWMGLTRDFENPNASSSSNSNGMDDEEKEQ